MSCITRLKYTTSVLPDHQTDIMNQLLDLFDPYRSFKVYREDIGRAERPVIPYLYVTCLICFLFSQYWKGCILNGFDIYRRG